jgi:hypothetical protein
LGGAGEVVHTGGGIGGHQCKVLLRVWNGPGPRGVGGAGVSAFPPKSQMIISHKLGRWSYIYF